MMSALTRPVLGLILGALLWGCSETNPAPSLLRKPSLHSESSGVKILNHLAPNALSTEDEITFSMGRGRPPERTDALSFQIECWSEDAPGKKMARSFQSPWRESIPAYEFVPEQALAPEMSLQKLSCLWDIQLKDDDGNINFQNDFPIQLDLTAGGMALMFENSPSLTLHEYILEHYRLEKLANPSELEINCEDLGSSLPSLAAFDFQDLVSRYLWIMKDQVSESDFLKCRILARSNGKLRFTPIFTLMRNYSDPILSLEAEIKNSGILQARAEIFNPNPFPVHLFFWNGNLWKDMTISYSAYGKTYALALGEGLANWRWPKGESVSLNLGGHLLSGTILELNAHGRLAVKSSTDIRPSFSCWSPLAPQILSVQVHLEKEAPIFNWRQDTLGGALNYTHDLRLPVNVQAQGYLSRVCG